MIKARKKQGSYLSNAVLSKYDNIKEVEFYDDSCQNIDDMNQVVKNLNQSIVT